MKKYTYTVDADLKSTRICSITDEQGNTVATVERVYSNKLKKLLDGYFDYRYFLHYVVKVNGEVTFQTKKIFRRGKVWFEATDIKHNKPYAILYENWRLAIPELSINGHNFEMKLDKEMEDWSNFKENGEIVARWKAIYIEESQQFIIDVEIDEKCSIQSVDFFAAIGQAVLFIGM